MEDLDHTDLEQLSAVVASLLLVDEDSGSDDLESLSNAIEAERLALDAPSLDRASLIQAHSELDTLLKARFDATGAEEDLKQSNFHSRQALSLSEPPDPQYVHLQHNLALGLWAWFRLKLDLAALDESIDLALSTVASSSPDSPSLPDFFHSVSVKLHSRFQMSGSLKDLEDSIRYVNLGLRIGTEDSMQRAEWCNDLASALESRFVELGNDEDIENAVEQSRLAVQLDPDDDVWLCNLGSILESRYNWSGNLDDLDEAITYAQKSIEAAGKESPYLASYLISLGSKLSLRSEASGDGADAEQAVNVVRRALKLSASNTADRFSHLATLASVLASRYERKGTTQDLQEANQILESLLTEAPLTHPDRTAWTGNIANHSWLLLQEGEVSIEQLTRIIGSVETAIENAPPTHSDIGPLCTALSVLLRTRHNVSSNISDLKRAIFWAQRATTTVGEESYRWATYHRNLGMQKLLLYVVEGQEDGELFTDALDSLARSANSAHAVPLGKIVAIRAAIGGLRLREDWSTARKLAAEALNLLPLVCGRYRTLDDQQYALMETAGLAADYCSLALKTGNAESALEQLELGRGVILGYMMDDHGDATAMKRDIPELAAKYEALRSKIPREFTEDVLPAARERLVADLKTVVGELEQCVEGIRQCKGYENFLCPPKVDDMIRWACDGPIVVVNVTEIGSDAIIVSENGLIHLSLPRMVRTSAPRLIRRFMKRRGGRDTTSRDVTADDANDDDTDEDEDQSASGLAWLSANCVGPVLEALKDIGLLSDPARPLRIWWVGSGLASSLPFHAALPATTDQTQGFDGSVISSYTPSLKALAHARKRAENSCSDSSERSKTSVLVVTMPTTPDHLPLPGAESEGRAVNLACHDIYPCEVLSSPGLDEVLPRISGIDILHFAGHGVPDRGNAFESHLLLQKEGPEGPEVDRLTLGKISQVSAGSGSWIAFLSACSTAEVQVRKLQDEGLHLAGAFQLAGFSHVIGSLWPLDDEVCVDVAGAFYRELVRAGGGRVSNRAVAAALQRAVAEIRTQYPLKPYKWAPFIHFGP